MRVIKSSKTGLHAVLIDMFSPASSGRFCFSFLLIYKDMEILGVFQYGGVE